jgi:hypothetical protein
MIFIFSFFDSFELETGFLNFLVFFLCLELSEELLSLRESSHASLPDEDSRELEEDRSRLRCFRVDFEDFFAFFFSLRFLDLRRLDSSELEDSSDELDETEGEGFFFFRFVESFMMIVVEGFLRNLA